ncbi:unnamed protein product [Rhodiola kirilowii]
MPAATHLKITKDEAGTKVDQTMYRSMIGSLLYLTTSRPDIAYAVGVCARYQADPKESHLLQVKMIIKYVCGTLNFGIWYTKDTNPYLVGYCDADWAGNAEDQKSTSGDYIAAGSCCTQLLWMKQMLSQYEVEQKEMTLYCDNMSTISISKNPVQHSRTKHIDIRHHFIRELVEQKVVTLKHVTTDKQLADIFTKPLDAVEFETLSSSLAVCCQELSVPGSGQS